LPLSLRKTCPPTRWAGLKPASIRQRRFRVDARPPVVLAVTPADRLMQPRQIQYPVHPFQNMIFRNQVPQRRRHEQILLPSIFSGLHRPSLPQFQLIKQGAVKDFFTSSAIPYFLYFLFTGSAVSCFQYLLLARSKCHLLLRSGEVLRQLFCDIAVSRGLRMAPGISRTIPVPQFILRQACLF